MRTILLIILLCTGVCRAQDVSPEDVAAKRKSEIISLVRQIQERARMAESEAVEARAARAAIKEVVAAQAEKLIGFGGVAAQLDAAKIQEKVLQDELDRQRAEIRRLDLVIKEKDNVIKEKDKALLEKDKRLADYRKFSLSILTGLALVVAVLVWQFLGKIGFSMAGIWGIVARIGISLAAGSAASWALWRFIVSGI